MTGSGQEHRMDLHPKHLRHFLEVVDSGSISAACENLSITQPALSKSIRQLELRLGVDLFIRLPSGVKLTRFGEIFARRAKLMEMEYRYALSEIGAAKSGAAGSISVGAGPGWIDMILPQVVTDFQKAHPKINFHVESGVIDTLIPRALNGDLDVLCCSLDFPDHPELVKVHLADMKHVIFAGLDHPLAKQEVIKPEDLVGHSWIFPTDDQVGRARLRSFFAACELPAPKIRAEIDSGFTALQKYVAGGNYLLSAPEFFRDDAERRGLKVIFRDDKLWQTPAGLVFRSTDKPGAVRNAFIELLKTHFQNHFHPLER